ncbi:MAG: hypothetical protein FDZ69_07580 [Deltaproteobacteria bacterium]|nr:MAG: hypothetical protein FDZ69_07580 [Deltaproteobacteria bacterium]
MTATELLILERLEAIERRLDVLAEPLLMEQARQLRAASHEAILEHNREVRRRAKSRAQGGMKSQTGRR